MKANRTNRLSRFLYEALVIICSILIAFSIDAWWSNKSDQTQTRALLATLNMDFKNSKKQLDELKSNHYELERNLEKLLIWSDTDTLPENYKIRFDSILGAIFWRQVFDPNMGTVESIISSSRFDLIKNQKLLSELTKWRALIENLNEIESSKINHFYNFLYPYLSAKVSLKDFDKGIPRKVQWNHDLTKAYELLEEPEFLNLIYMHWVIQWNINKEIPEVENTIISILDISKAELLKYK
ncbi:MAG: hypothetical protein KAJ23_18600 [Maribacter sp.]|nr:hypothetical protein [Maribacter sp.]